MTYDWNLIQTTIFIVTPFFLMLALTKNDDEDDDPGSGMFVPALEVD